MTNAKRNNKTVFLILGLLLVISLAGTLYFYNQSQKKYAPVKKLLHDYGELEAAYMKTVTELEEASSGEFDNIGILKQNLRDILEEIKKEKQRIDANRKNPENVILDTSVTQNLREKLEMSKQVADAILVARIEEVERQNEQLAKNNKALQKQNVKLEQNLEKMKNYYEEQKVKNESLKAAVEFINQELKEMESEGDANDEKLAEMKKKRDEYKKKLERSEQTILAQNQQINQFIETMKKVNLNCYFIYEENNPEKETKIYLTSSGISKQYKKYFDKNKPKVHIEFTLNQKLFANEVNKIDLLVFNSANIEIFGSSEAIKGGTQNIKLSGNLFKPGKYRIKLRNGSEDLVIGGEYVIAL